MWLIPAAPLLLLAGLLLVVFVYDRTSAVHSWQIALEPYLLYALLILIPASLVIGIVVLIVLVVMCLAKKLRWTARKTLISACLACVDVLLPVGLVVGGAYYLKHHPLRIMIF